MDIKDFEQCRNILLEMKSKRHPVAGGSGRTGRYKMPDTSLYYKLGIILDRICRIKGVTDDQKTEYVRYLTRDLRKEFFDDYGDTHVFTDSLRFATRFKDLQYFQHVSEVCGGTLKRIEAAELIFASDNPLGITAKDLKAFEKRLNNPNMTYKEMQSACTKFRTRFEGESDAKLDYSDVRNSFDSTVTLIDDSLEATKDRRTELRLTIRQLITPLRYLLQLLANENVFTKKFQEVKSMLSRASRGTGCVPDPMRELYKQLLQFTNSQKAREKLRKEITPYDMTELQTKIRAVESEENYKDYKNQKEMFKKIPF